MKVKKSRKKTTRLLDLDVDFISICREGMNGLKAVYKSDDGRFRLDGPIVKANQEKGELTGVIYVPGQPDLEEEWADAETIRKAAHSWMAKGARVDTDHDEKPRDDIRPVESFIIQKGDPRFADVTDKDGKAVDCTGGWGVVMKLQTEEARKKYRDEAWKGLSLGGRARAVEQAPNEPNLLAQLAKALKSLIGADATSTTNPKTKPKKMDEEQQKALLEAITKAVATGFTQATKKSTSAPVDDEIEFDGDLEDVEEIEAFLEEEDPARMSRKALKARLKDLRRKTRKSNQRRVTRKSDDDYDDLEAVNSAREFQGRALVKE